MLNVCLIPRVGCRQGFKRYKTNVYYYGSSCIDDCCNSHCLRRNEKKKHNTTRTPNHSDALVYSSDLSWRRDMISTHSSTLRWDVTHLVYLQMANTHGNLGWKSGGEVTLAWNSNSVSDTTTGGLPTPTSISWLGLKPHHRLPVSGQQPQFLSRLHIKLHRGRVSARN